MPETSGRPRARNLTKEHSGMSMVKRFAVTAATVLGLMLFFGGSVLFVSVHELEGAVEDEADQDEADD